VLLRPLLLFGDEDIVTGGGKATKYRGLQLLHRAKDEVNSPVDSLLLMISMEHALLLPRKIVFK
jgi:hypothetical protein